jgi:peptidyl-prolyl cis-trans isomerase C
MKSFSARRAALLMGVVAGLAAAPAFAADKDPVVATVNGVELRQSAVTAYQRTLPPQMAAQVPMEALIESLINNQLVYDLAKKDGADKDAEVKQALKQVEQQIVVKSWMGKKLKAEITDEAVKKAYDKFITEFKPVEEVRARHILTETEDQAKAVIAELKKGSDFAELAKTKSKDPSAAQNGGDLGYFTKEEMVPQFAEAAFAMKPGELSPAPVKSQFGFHVIKLEDRRMAAPPTFEQAKPAIREQLAEETAQKVVMDARAKAKVKRFDADGKPLPEAK